MTVGTVECDYRVIVCSGCRAVFCVAGALKSQSVVCCVKSTHWLDSFALWRNLVLHYTMSKPYGVYFFDYSENVCVALMLAVDIRRLCGGYWLVCARQLVYLEFLMLLRAWELCLFAAHTSTGRRWWREHDQEGVS